MTNLQKISQGARFSLVKHPERVFRIKGNVTFEFIVRNNGITIFE